MHPLLDQSNLVSTPIQEGDAGIVLKPDGSFQIFSTGKIDPNAMTAAQLEQGVKLVALAIALKVPQVMEVLIQLSNDPDVTGKNVLEIKKEFKH